MASGGNVADELVQAIARIKHCSDAEAADILIERASAEDEREAEQVVG